MLIDERVWHYTGEFSVSLLHYISHESYRRREMYSGHGSLPSVCLCVCPSPHLRAPDVTWGNGSGCPLVVHYRADLQTVHGFRCYDNIAPNARCQRVLVLAVCLINAIVFRVNVMKLE